MIHSYRLCKRHILKSQWTSSSLSRLCRRYATNIPPLRLAIIGSGPAGFYSAYRVLARTNAVVDMYERLPVPFGLVRFGVAPDHPEVKNCQDRFTEVASSLHFNFIGNVNVGEDIKLSHLCEQYDAVLFAYGASKDRELGVDGEHLQGIYSARAFVGWYNGLPEYASLAPDLQSGDTAIVIGQGNVALDIARVLVSNVDRLRTTDIAGNALDALSRSSIRKVHVVGRRGPLQASFTIKELRELIQLPDIQFEPIPAHLLPSTGIKLPRAQKRITELLRTHSSTQNHSSSMNNLSKGISLDFLQSPVYFNADRDNSDKLASVTFSRNKYKEGSDPFHASAGVEPTNESETLKASLVFRSIGYKSEPLDGMQELGIEFDTATGTIPNVAGRVVDGEGTPIPSLYCAGWVKRGPTGVIATTMEDAFSTAEIIVSDWANKAGSEKPGWETLRSSLPHATDWKDWLKIDAAERKIGQAQGKEREKFCSIDQMLAVIR